MDFTDTHPKIQAILLAGYRKMSPQEKMKRVSELTKSVQQLALARIQKDFPESSEKEQQLRLASLWLDEKVMAEVFGWNPNQKRY